MIRFLGQPTFFCTFSPAEHDWKDLMRNLLLVVDKKKPEDITDDFIENLTKEDKQRLILADPITCARHFNHRTKKLFTTYLKSKSQPLGELSDYFYRVEFQ